MSVEQMGEVWKLDLAPNKRLVLLAYADHADDDGDNVYPSLGRVAHKTGYSRDQVRRISKELAEDGLMEPVSQDDPDNNKPRRWRLTLENGTKTPPFKARRGGGNMQPPTPSPPGANDPPGAGAPVPPEPSVEPPGKEPSEPKGSSGADAPQDKKVYPANAMTTETVNRTDQVGFFASDPQKANWGQGWANYVYVPEGQEPPPLSEQYAVLSEIVEAAAGKRGRSAFFLSVKDAVARVRGEVAELRPGKPKKQPSVKWEYEELVVNGVIETDRRVWRELGHLAKNPEDAPPEWQGAGRAG